MTENPNRIQGTVRADGDTGAVRVEARLPLPADAVWAAATDPRRLGEWLGVVEGDLQPGGEFRARFFASGWEGTGRIEACEPQRRLLVLTKDADAADGPFDHAIELTLTPDGGETILAWEERGMPVDLVAAYGAGVQVHVEDLAAHLAGGERCDAPARFGVLFPAYRELAAALG